MKNKVCMIGHRGFSGKYFMNTELAFTKAAENGSGGAETDIRITADGVYVCSHDNEVRLKDGRVLLVSESTFAELTSQPIKQDKTDDDVYLCKYERYLEIMKANDMICFIELKGRFSDAQIKEIFTIASEKYDLKKCILQSFSFDNLIKSREMFPELPLMFTYGQGQRDYWKCFEKGISIDIDYWLVSKKLVTEFHDRGLEVAVWTVNDENALTFCTAMGVDYIESDIFGGRE